LRSNLTMGFAPKTKKMLGSFFAHVLILRSLNGPERNYGSDLKMPLDFWCGRRDLNPHAVRRHPLKMVCLPISPLPHGVNQLSIAKNQWRRWGVGSRSQGIQFKSVLMNTDF
jgi:hypothetical protein